MGDHDFVYEKPGVLCAWRNSLRRDGVTVEIGLDFFSKRQDGTYDRFSEVFSERAYTRQELAGALDHAGFDLLEVWGDCLFEAPDLEAQRQVYVAKKR